MKMDRLQKYNRRSGFNYSRVIGVGGSTLHYQGEAHRFPEHAFKLQSHYGYGHDWPVDYQQLEPYYERMEKWLGVAGNPGNPFKSARGPFPTPGHDLSTKSQWVRQACDKLGWSLLPNTLALPSRYYDGRSPCQYSGMCTRGCPFGAKSSIDLAVLPTAIKSGKLKIITNARALEIETDAKGSVAAVSYLEKGVPKRVSADRYVLSAGGIETPRLLLSSQGNRHQNGVGNNHDRVGRNLMETVFSMITVEADMPLQSWKGQPIDSRIWDFNRPHRDQAINGFVLGVSSSMTSEVGPLSYSLRTAGSGIAHKNAMRNRFGRVVNLFGIAEHCPDENNRVVLSDKVDDQGIPKVSIRSDYNVIDKNTMREMIGKLKILAEATRPAKIRELYSSYDNSSATHLAGTCMMGNDPETSVVNASGRVHDVENLYIADASILPGQGMGDSPSLTIQSLALMIAEKME
jgi:choline dehydrogenase-like flavoprotein